MRFRANSEAAAVFEMPVRNEPGRPPERNFRYHVRRGQLDGGNVSGECSRVEITRSGVLVIIGHGKIKRYAPNTWMECETTEVWSQGGES